jgi:hypothetical protein
VLASTPFSRSATGLRWAIVPLSLYAAVAALATSLPEQADWQQTGEKNGVREFQTAVDGSSIPAFRATAVIDASMERIAGVIGDAERISEWVPRLVEARIVRSITDLERFEWWRFDMPFGIGDREFHVRTAMEYDRLKDCLLFHATSAVDPAFPQPKHVLGELMSGGYLLRRVGPERTEVEFFLHADMRMGIFALGIWYLQKRNVRENLEALRKRLQRPDAAVFLSRFLSPEVARLAREKDPFAGTEVTLRVTVRWALRAPQPHEPRSLP